MRLPPFRGSMRPTGALRLNVDSPLARGLVALWPLHQDSSPVVGALPLAINGGIAWTGTADGPAPSFNGSSQYLRAAPPPVSAAPFSAACWFAPTVGTSVRTLWSIGDTGGDSDYFRCVYDESAGRIDVEARHVGISEVYASPVTEGVWNHAVAVYASDIDRRAYLNGVAGAAEVSPTSTVPTGLDAMAIGRLERASPVHYFGGHIAYFGIWDRALAAHEVWYLYAPETRHDLVVPA